MAVFPYVEAEKMSAVGASEPFGEGSYSSLARTCAPIALSLHGAMCEQVSWEQQAVSDGTLHATVLRELCKLCIWCENSKQRTCVLLLADAPQLDSMQGPVQLAAPYMRGGRPVGR